MSRRPYRIDPEVARERASKAGRASHGIDAHINALVRDVVGSAPALNAEQIEKIRGLLPPADLGARKAAG